VTRGLLAEFGIGIPKKPEPTLLMARQVVDGKSPDVPIEAAKMTARRSRPSTPAFDAARSTR